MTTMDVNVMGELGNDLSSFTPKGYAGLVARTPVAPNNNGPYGPMINYDHLSGEKSRVILMTGQIGDLSLPALFWNLSISGSFVTRLVSVLWFFYRILSSKRSSLSWTTMATVWLRARFIGLIFFSELAFIIIFGCLVDYGWDATPVSLRPQFLGRSHAVWGTTGGGNSGTSSAETSGAGFNMSALRTDNLSPDLSIARFPQEQYYPMFQDVHVMVFIGFGFLMTFLRKYGYGAVGFTFILAALVLQWATCLRGFFRLSHNNWRIPLDLSSIIGADFSAATILISLGVVLGKLAPAQYVFMVLFETVFVTLNEWICMDLLLIKDAGGTVVIHLFGAVFGLSLARVIHRKEWSVEGFNTLKFGTHYTDLLSLLGTLFLWMFWPSFNAALATDDGKYRAIYNTYFAISASCLGAYMTSYLIATSKFSLDIIQNATLAGGVVVGAICDLYLYPWGALVCGFVVGCISSCGFRYLGEIIDRWGFHDTCGVNNLHCIPGFLGSLMSAIVVACASKEVYGSSYYANFPMHAPPANTPEFRQLQLILPDVKPGLGWTPSIQGGYQMAGIGVTIAIAITGAVLTGLFLRLPAFRPPDMSIVMSDDPFWHGPRKLKKIDEIALREKIHQHTYGKSLYNVDTKAEEVGNNHNGQVLHMTPRQTKEMEMHQE